MTTLDRKRFEQNIDDFERKERARNLIIPEEAYRRIKERLEEATVQGERTITIKLGEFPCIDDDPLFLTTKGLTVKGKFDCVEPCEHAFECGSHCPGNKMVLVGIVIGF